MGIRALAGLVAAMAAGMFGFPAAWGGDGVEDVRFVLDGARKSADAGRLPRVTCSDESYGGFATEFLQRHLSFDERGVYQGGGPMLGATDHMWVLEWDSWMLPWVDRGALGLARQGGDDTDVILSTLANCTIDRFGYAFGSVLCPEPNLSLGGYKPAFGWPWPKYNRNTTSKLATGWDFNDAGDSGIGGWRARAIALDPLPTDGRMIGRVLGPDAALDSPAFDTDSLQAPIVEIDLEVSGPGLVDPATTLRGLRVLWSTAERPGFHAARSVGIGDCVLPPADFPADYARMAGPGRARFPLYFPMCMHPEWGAGGRRITGLRIVPGEGVTPGMTLAVNYVRATYDVRMTTTNASLVNGAAQFFLWSGDEAFLRRMMPRLRRVMLFLNEHLRGRREGLLCTDWLIGHDGLGGDAPGHGMIGSYWDLLPAGRFDLESSLAYYAALRNMARLERACTARGIDPGPARVTGPDGRRTVAWAETAGSLDRMAAGTKRAIERRLWNPATGRFARNLDARGRLHDYGFLHHNLLALAWGVGTRAQRASILSWLDGRVIDGDTAVGADIYRWRFAPRTSTRRNTDYYFWPWIADWRAEPNSPYRAWGDQMQDGGAIPMTALWEAMARCGAGSQAGIDRAFGRAREVQAWFADVKSAGGRGRDFYRAWYDGHPERGKQQSPMPGGLGLDREFLSDAALGAAVPVYAWLGVQAEEDGELRIAPALPSALEHVGVQNLYWRGSHLNIEARRGVVSFAGSRFGSTDGLRVRVVLPGAGAGARMLADGVATAARALPGGRLEALAPLGTLRVEVAPAPGGGGARR